MDLFSVFVSRHSRNEKIYSTQQPKLILSMHFEVFQTKIP